MQGLHLVNKQTKHGQPKRVLPFLSSVLIKYIKTKPEHNELYYISKSRLWKQLNHIPLLIPILHYVNKQTNRSVWTYVTLNRGS